MPYDKLILVPGAQPVLPRVEGTSAANVFVLRNIEDTERLSAFLNEAHPKRAVVVGAGFIGPATNEALVAADRSTAVGTEITKPKLPPARCCGTVRPPQAPRESLRWAFWAEILWKTGGRWP